jgi:hypothetical protein
MSFFKAFQASFHYQCWTYVVNYNSIESLLTMIGQLQHLTQLWLRRCESFKKLQNIASLFSLSMLDLFGCNSIESLSTIIRES